MTPVLWRLYNDVYTWRYRRLEGRTEAGIKLGCSPIEGRQACVTNRRLNTSDSLQRATGGSTVYQVNSRHAGRRSVKCMNVWMYECINVLYTYLSTVRCKIETQACLPPVDKQPSLILPELYTYTRSVSAVSDRSAAFGPLQPFPLPAVFLVLGYLHWAPLTP